MLRQLILVVRCHEDTRNTHNITSWLFRFDFVRPCVGCTCHCQCLCSLWITPVATLGALTLSVRRAYRPRNQRSSTVRFPRQTCSFGDNRQMACWARSGLPASSFGQHAGPSSSSASSAPPRGGLTQALGAYERNRKKQTHVIATRNWQSDTSRASCHKVCCCSLSNCNRQLHEMGRFFKAPAGKDTEQWAKVEALYNAGFRFFSYRSFDCPPLPGRLSEVKAFIRNNPKHPMLVAAPNYAIKATSVERLDSSVASGASAPYFGC